MVVESHRSKISLASRKNAFGAAFGMIPHFSVRRVHVWHFDEGILSQIRLHTIGICRCKSLKYLYQFLHMSSHTMPIGNHTLARQTWTAITGDLRATIAPERRCWTTCPTFVRSSANLNCTRKLQHVLQPFLWLWRPFHRPS